MLKFKMAAISTTETRIGGGSKVETVTTSCGKFKYKHYTSGGVNKITRHGVGIITPAETNLDFQAVNERLCKATIHQGKNKSNIVIAAKCACASSYLDAFDKEFPCRFVWMDGWLDGRIICK